MAYSVNNCIKNDQEHNLKHFCKICKKGFGCGRALGGHMRAHGIGDESGLMEDDEDEDQANDWDDQMAGPSNVPSTMMINAGGNKPMYALRTNPNRVKTCRACQNCGKEFSSWKSFLEHGKCGVDSDEERSPISSPESNSDDHKRSKRKSSLRSSYGNFNCPSREDEDLAHCLMMLSNANSEYSHNQHCNQQHQVEPDHESCASANRDDHFNNPMMGIQISAGIKDKSVAKGLFECKACKKVFNSHQALGGHRASHKKVKGCFAAKLDENNHNSLFDGETITNYKDDQFTVPSTKSTSYALQSANTTVPATTQHLSSTPSSSKRKSKVHECSVCHRVFSSGQALGGHKRCHWITSSNVGQNAAFPHFDQFKANATKLDLNFPTFNNPQQRTALSFEISAENYFLQNNELKCSGEVTSNNNNNNNNVSTKSNNNVSTKNNNNVLEQEVDNDVDDDANSKMRLAKLSDLKDVKEGGEGSCSSWLQVGLGSTTTDNVVVVGDENIG